MRNMTCALRHADWLTALYLGALLLTLWCPPGRTEHLGTDFAWMAGVKGRGNEACCAVFDCVEATVALFPYRPELDQSGALLQALGAGVPAVAYDVGGIAEPVRRFGAGRVVPAGDVEALAAATRELLESPDALADARAGARRARETLTWDAAAAAHLDLYRQLV